MSTVNTSLASTPIFKSPKLNSPEKIPLPRPELPPPSPKPARHEAILAAFIDQYNLPSEVATSILKAVYLAQSTLGPKETNTIPPTETFRNFIAVESRGFHIYAPSSSNGGNGSVFVGPFIATERTTMGNEEFSPSKPKQVARKVSHRESKIGYSPVKRQVDALREAVSPSKKELIAPIYSTSQDQAGRKHMIMPAFSHNYEGINWTEIVNPAHYLMTKVRLVADALSGLHKLNKVHRDVKGANVMDGELCALIDFDTLQDTFEEMDFTTGTPDHLNPRSFGSLEETLKNQRLRQGLQRPCDDMFALYHMGIQLALNLCAQLIPESEREAHQLIKQLKRPKVYKPPLGNLVFIQTQLEGLGKQYPYQAHFFHGNRRNGTPERVAIYPDADTYKTKFATIVASLPLSEAEKTHLLTFVSYCAEQKFLPDNVRADAVSASTELAQTLDSLETSHQAHTRKRSGITESDRPTKKSRRHAQTQPTDLPNPPEHRADWTV